MITEEPSRASCTSAKKLVQKLYIEQRTIAPATQVTFLKHLENCIHCSTYLTLIKEEWSISKT